VRIVNTPPTPRGARHARRCCLPLALLFMPTMAVPVARWRCRAAGALCALRQHNHLSPMVCGSRRVYFGEWTAYFDILWPYLAVDVYGNGGGYCV
jgi:hypothetical protein